MKQAAVNVISQAPTHPRQLIFQMYILSIAETEFLLKHGAIFAQYAILDGMKKIMMMMFRGFIVPISI